jgi:hypothetical protein
MIPGRLVSSRTVRWTALTIVLAVPAAGFAQPPAEQPPSAQPPAAPPLGRGNRGAGFTNAEVVTMLDAYAMFQAQQVLQLSDEQYGQFVTRLRHLQETRRRNMQVRNRLVQELRKMTAPDATTDEAMLRDRLKALRELDEQSVASMRREYDALDEVLDARQQAVFRVFEERLERQKLDLLVRARERAARPGTAPPRKPGGGF